MGDPAEHAEHAFTDFFSYSTQVFGEFFQVGLRFGLRFAAESDFTSRIYVDDVRLAG